MSGIAYVAGLLFSSDGKLVALVRKNRPAWQAGRLNAIGGKIEGDETPLQAMVREFVEETGVLTHGSTWSPVAVLAGGFGAVHFFAAWDDRALDRIRTMTDEAIVTFAVGIALSARDLIPNLRIIVPLALDRSGIRKPVGLLQLDDPAAP